MAGKSPFLNEADYYLAGGTALALQLGHRQSLDFDLFSPQKGLAERTQDWLSSFSAVIPRDMDQHTLHVEADGIKVSFISAYRYKLIDPPLRYNHLKLKDILQKEVKSVAG